MVKKQVFILLPVILMSVFSGGCGDKSAEAATADMSVAVETEQVKTGSLKVDNSYIGTVMDVGAVNVVPLVNAEVTSVNVAVGDIVQEGDVLCQMDDTDAQFNLLNAQTSYNNAKTSYENAKAGYEKAAAAYNTQVAVYNDSVAASDAKLGSSYMLSEYNDSVNLDNLRKQLNRYQEDLADYREEYEDQSDEADDLEKKRKKAKKEMEAAQAAYDSLIKKKEGLQEKLQALEESAQTKAVNVSVSGNDASYGEAAPDDITAQIEQTKAELEAVEGEIEAARQKYEAAKANYETLKAQSSAADDALDQMEDTLENMEQTRDDKSEAVAQEEYRQSITYGLGYEEKIRDVETDKAVALANLDSALINMETSQIGIDSAQISMDAAQISIDSAKYKLGLYTLKAPVSGVVEQVNVTANNMGSTNQASFVITDPDSKTVVFYVQGDVRKELKTGQKVTIFCNNEKYAGSINEIGVAVDAQTGMFQVKAGITNGKEIANGTQVELVTVAHEEDNALIIPLDAVYFEDGVPYIYIYEDGIAKKTEIDIALHDAEKIVTTNRGLAGKEIITSWSSNLQDGAKVHKSREEEK